MNKANPKPQIAFRIPQRLHDMLEKKGSAVDMSKHEFARQLVIEYLADADRHRLLDQVTILQNSFALFKRGMGAAVANLLAAQGMDPEKANQWVGENILD